MKLIRFPYRLLIVVYIALALERERQTPKTRKTNLRRLLPFAPSLVGAACAAYASSVLFWGDNLGGRTSRT